MGLLGSAVTHNLLHKVRSTPWIGLLILVAKAMQMVQGFCFSVTQQCGLKGLLISLITLKSNVYML